MSPFGPPGTQQTRRYEKPLWGWMRSWATGQLAPEVYTLCSLAAIREPGKLRGWPPRSAASTNHYTAFAIPLNTHGAVPG